MAQYINKTALVTEIERIMNEQQEICKADVSHGKKYPDGKNVEVIYQFQQLIKFLDTLEVKEANFDNDLFEEVYSHLDDIKDTADRMTSGNFMHHRAAIKYSANVIEKVLGLIGLKAQKGE